MSVPLSEDSLKAILNHSSRHLSSIVMVSIQLMLLVTAVMTTMMVTAMRPRILARCTPSHWPRAWERDGHPSPRRPVQTMSRDGGGGRRRRGGGGEGRRQSRAPWPGRRGPASHRGPAEMRLKRLPGNVTPSHPRDRPHESHTCRRVHVAIRCRIHRQ